MSVTDTKGAGGGGGQRLVSRFGHDEHSGVFEGVGTGVDTEVGVVCTVFVVGIDVVVVVGVSWQAVGSNSGPSRISCNVAAWARQATKNARKGLRSMVQA